MSAYGAVAQDEVEEATFRWNDCADSDTILPDWLLLYLKGGPISEEHVRLLQGRKPQRMPKDVFEIHPESLRQLAYIGFWIMAALAHVFSAVFVPEGMIEHSHLLDVFGFNNICVYWDYRPSREWIGMMYPFVEIFFLSYIVLDFVHLRLACKSHSIVTNNDDAKRLYRVNKFLLPFKFVLVLWFRLIFVYTVYEDKQLEILDEPPSKTYGLRGVVGHTLGFYGLQLGMIFIAVDNVLFMNATGIYFRFLGQKWTKRLAWLYLLLFVANTTSQIIIGTFIFSGKPLFSVTGPDAIPSHVLFLKIIDRSWMVLVAIMPVWFSQHGRKHQVPIKITLTLYSEAWEEDTIPLEPEPVLMKRLSVTAPPTTPA